MSPLWTMHRAAILRWAGPWLMVQPILAALAFASPKGAELLEGELVFVAGLVAFGLHRGLSRERMEYLRQLPIARERVERSMHAAALTVILGASLFAYFSEVTGLVLYTLISAVHAVFAGVPAPVLKVHAFRWPWLNVFALPVLAYWGVAAALRLRRSLAPESGASRGQWFLFGVLLVAAFFPFLGRVSSDVVRTSIEHNAWERNLPGAIALLLCGPLARGYAGRVVRLGVDAYPVEEASWES